MLRNFKYRIYPNKIQEQVFDQTLTTCRYLYNSALEERIKEYKNSNRSIGYLEQQNDLSLYKDNYQQQVYCQVLHNVLWRLDKSFKSFFNGIDSKNKIGFPRFKSENRYRSFCYTQYGFKLIENNRYIQLSKIGNIRIIYNRSIEGKIKTCTILKDVDQWFVILTCDITNNIVVQNNKPSIGIDVGLENFATLSNGNIIENPRLLQKSQKRLKKEQRRLARKKNKNSTRRRKQRIRLEKVYRKIRRQREDFLHKESTKLVKQYGTIIFEKLNIRSMMKNPQYAKYIGDASWNKFIQLTTYKAESAGGKVMLVDPRNTSQICSNCGKFVEKKVFERSHNCPNCNTVLHRDHNAAINIHTAGSAEIYAHGDNVRQINSDENLS